MTEITVKNQKELDAVPMDFHGRIYINFGTITKPAILTRTWENARAVLRENARAVLRENASAVLWENASAELRGNARAVLRENASAVLWENASAELWENARAVLWENASAELRGNASAVLWENASAVLRENARAELWGNARAELWGNAQAVDKTKSHKVQTHGNSRIVYDPQSLDEYVVYHDITAQDGKLTLYKAVHKRNGKYLSSYVDFEYTIGETAFPDRFDENEIACSHGIHLAPLHWALDFGRTWDDLAILEMSVEKADIVYPKDTDWKVRARKAVPVREVPMEECGLLGEWIALDRKAKQESEVQDND